MLRIYKTAVESQSLRPLLSSWLNNPSGLFEAFVNY